MIRQPDDRYRSYLLRLWCVSFGDAQVWRGSLECVQTHTRCNFATLDDLYAHLRQEIEVVAQRAEVVSQIVD